MKALSTKNGTLCLIRFHSTAAGRLLLGGRLSRLRRGQLRHVLEAWPARYLAEAYRGGEALLAAKTQYNSPYPVGFWERARTEARVTVYNPTKALNGYTLFTSGEGQRAA